MYLRAQAIRKRIIWAYLGFERYRGWMWEARASKARAVVGPG